MTAQQALYMFGSFHYFAFCMLIFQPFAASSQLLQTQKVGKIPRPPAREIGRISRWHLPDLNFTPNNERTYHLISGQYYKLQLENRDLGRITLWYSNYKKDLHSLGRRMALRMAFQAMAKPSREEFVTAFFFQLMMIL
jgi:hypothetical protein